MEQPMLRSVPMNPCRVATIVSFILLGLLAMAPISVAQSTSSFQDLPIDEFFDASYVQWLRRDPERITTLGLADQLGVRNDKLTDVSTAYAEETAALLQEIQAVLHSYDRESLSEDESLSYDVYEWFLQDQLDQLAYRMSDYLITSFTFYSEDWQLMDLFQSSHPLETHEDVEDYISRLSKVEWKLGQLIDELLARKEEGIVAPQFMLTRSITQIKNWLGLFLAVPEDVSGISPFATEIYKSIHSRLRDCDWLTSEERLAYRDRIVEQIRDSYLPGYFELLTTLQALFEVAPAEGGATAMPNGSAYLTHAIQHHTTLALTPEEMLALGDSEVARIDAEMREIFATMGYPRDAAIRDLWNMAYADAELPENLSWLEEYGRIQAEIEAAIEPLFDLQPYADLEVHLAPEGTAVNYYNAPALDGSRPGIFYAQSSANPLSIYSMPVIFHHEAIPGHHFQIALIRELDLPLFRRIEVPTSNIEGWAMYAEGLAAELGLYTDNPLANLERLRLELMRAARVVVEMGVHNLSWTHTEGAQFFADVMGYPLDAMIGIMPRYVGYPGQGSSYTVGLLQMRELRKRAEDTLDDAFELSDFHNVILQDGALPLAILEQQVDAYIDSRLATSN